MWLAQSASGRDVCGVLPSAGMLPPSASLSLAGQDRATLEAWLAERGASRSHARRVLRAFHDGLGDLDVEALLLGKSLSVAFRERWRTDASHEHSRVEAADGTVKLLLALRRGGAVEAVMMPSYRAGEAWCCVSSQIGCAMGCDFCASTRGGLERNLEVDEIVEQYLAVGRVAAERGLRLRTLVFMGMGEPLHNFDAVTRSIDLIAGPGLGNLGWSRITVSTVGIVHGIERLADRPFPPSLALSLHAPDDETRARIVPTNSRYDVATILAAAQAYQARTRKIVTLEYCLLRGVNDHDWQAELLAERMRGFPAHVNVIPYNATGSGSRGIVYIRPSEQRVAHFVSMLRARGVVAHVRVARGDDVAAACGQLREISQGT